MNFLHTFNLFFGFQLTGFQLITLGVFVCLVLLSIRMYYTSVIKARKTKKINSKDLTAIAGDDLYATQLDLAKAYLEARQTELANQLLKTIKKKGTPEQRQQAKELMS